MLGETQQTPHWGWDPPGSSSWSALELGTQQVGKSPAQLLLPQSLGADDFSCLLVTYRDAGQSSFLRRLPGEALLPALHARKAMAVLPKASPSPAPGDKREPCPCFRCKWEQLVRMLHLFCYSPRPDNCSIPRTAGKHALSLGSIAKQPRLSQDLCLRICKQDSDHKNISVSLMEDQG